MTTQQKAYIALGATSIIWGTTWIAMKLGVQQMPALQMAAMRQLIGGSILVGFFLCKGFTIPSAPQLKRVFILSIFTFVLANGLSMWSMEFIPSGLGAMIGSLYPLVVVLMEFFFFKNRNVKPMGFLGILLGLAGICMVLYQKAFDAHPQGYFWGVLLSVTATISWSYSTITIARQKMKMNPYYGMGWQMLFGSILMGLFCWIRGDYIALEKIGSQAWLSMAYLIVFGSILALIAFIFSMKYLPAAIASLYAYINPIVAILLGTVLLKESISFSFVLGSLITLTGVYLVNKSTKRQGSINQSDGL
jgi:drug/metabolite transporter (DMT)-like permease